MWDYVIVGAGLTGSVMARLLQDAGLKVVVLEKRNHVGGNVHDHVHPSGVRIHTYGPHFFRTNSEELWTFVHRFAKFYKYEPQVKSLIDGKLESWPVTAECIERISGKDWTPSFSGVASNFEEASLKMMPREIYEKFVKGYTEKQWGVPASTLGVELARRFEVHLDNEARFMRHKFQGLPENGFDEFSKNILAGIPHLLNFDYLKNRDVFRPKFQTIYTGPIDEFFEFNLGRLSYRSQRREHRVVDGVGYVQPCAQINNPSHLSGGHIRSIEWKHMMRTEHTQHIQASVITTETPFTPHNSTEYEYPFPDGQNKQLYERYRQQAAELDDFVICGRLGEYKYYDMDQAIARAQMIARKILKKHQA